MRGTSDSLTVALTGQLPFVVLVAAVLALPVSFFLLWLYRRAVLRSMRGRSGAAVPSASSAQTSSSPSSSIELSFESASAGLPLGPHAEPLFRQVERGPWQAAAIYCVAGGGYALVMSLVWLVATREAFLPVRFLWLFWTYAWPVVLTVNLVAGSTVRRKAYLVLGYFAVLGVLAAIALARSPQAHDLAAHHCLLAGDQRPAHSPAGGFSYPPDQGRRTSCDHLHGRGGHRVADWTRALPVGMNASSVSLLESASASASPARAYSIRSS